VSLVESFACRPIVAVYRPLDLHCIGLN